MKTNNILIADDHYIVRGGLQIICDIHFPEYNLYFAESSCEIIGHLTTRAFDLIIIDIDFGEENTLNFVDQIFNLQPKVNMLVYSGLNENIFAKKVLKLGIKGFLSKSSDESEIIKAIQQVLLGQNYLSPMMDSDGMMKGSSLNNPLDCLSKRELEITMLYVKGYGNLEISNSLDIGKTTISTYKKRIFDKLHINTLPELIDLYHIYA